ncbi:hypothetical protein ACTHQY_14865, partial [Rhodococcoides corynebacterioides]|uniref:hypothetical protein n=1 Tax=Rhodococcoides corynebacterioides TaxID=53972 RepID=UPI003F800553
MPLGSCLVRVNLTALVIDGVDADDHPDSVPLSATLALEPMVKTGKMLQYNDAGVAKLKALTRIEVEIGPLGDIVDRDRDYVKVPAPDATTTNMSELQWRAKFENVKYGAKVVTVDDIFFYAVPGGEINLADHINVAPSSTAVQIIRGPRGYGVVDVQNDDGELVFLAGPEDDPAAQSEVGRVAAPSANVTNSAVAPLVSTAGVTRDAVDTRVATVGDQRYATLEAAAGLSEVVDTKLSKAVADQNYAPAARALPTGGSAGQVPVKTA